MITMNQRKREVRMSLKIKKYIGHISAMIVLAGIVGTVTFQSRQRHNDVRPKNAKEFAQTSAMIVLPTKDSGGSGVILKSSEKESIILTNKHVCEVIQGGGIVMTSGRDYKISQYKIYKKHDLCMIKVLANLGINTVVAEKAPEMYSHAYVSGHPSLLPHVLTDGYFSNYKTIEILVDMKECSEEDMEKNALGCLFMGGVPVVKNFDAQLVTATIMPGSSGSGVFNEDGEISGLVFAGSAQGLSYGFIVPLSHVQNFIATQDTYKWRKPYRDSNQKFLSTMIGQKIQIACRYNKLYTPNCAPVEGVN